MWGVLLGRGVAVRVGELVADGSNVGRGAGGEGRRAVAEAAGSVIVGGGRTGGGAQAASKIDQRPTRVNTRMVVIVSDKRVCR